MKKHGKKWQMASKVVDMGKSHTIEEATSLLKETGYMKFDGSVDANIRISYKSLQNVRGMFQLPHGTGKSIRVLVFAREDKHAEAKEAGAEYVGSADLIEKIQREKWTDFDACVATPDMMKDVGKLGQILGRKGLMPKPKAGTVTVDVSQAIKKIKSGFMEYRSDKTGVVSVKVGRVSFSPEKLQENIKALYRSLIKEKPSDAKGEYIRSFFVSASMGPGIRLNHRLLG